MMNFLSFALREGAVFSLNSTLALCVTWERGTAESKQNFSLAEACGRYRLQCRCIFFLFFSAARAHNTRPAPHPGLLGPLSFSTCRQDTLILEAYKSPSSFHWVGTRKGNCG